MSRFLRALVGGAVIGLAMAASAVQAEERLALVIGNGAYANVATLPNPVNDGRAMAAVLREAKFEVSAIENADRASLAEAVAAFGRRVAKAGPDAVAFVYYAGHAAQLEGRNFLMPIDARAGDAEALKAGAVDVDAILKTLDATPARSRIVVLDACRDNPFRGGGAASPRGLTAPASAVEVPGETGVTRVDARIGTLVAFATSPGATAADGEGGHSPYAAALIKLMREPGLSVEALFRRARLAVHDATGGEQTPWETSSLTGEFSFFPGPATGPAAAATERALPARAREVLAPGVTRERLRTIGAADAYALTIYLGTLEVQRLYVEAYPFEARSLTIYRLLATTTQEIAWAQAVASGTPEALVAFGAAYPGSVHAAELARLLPLRSRTLVTASICPPTAPLPIQRAIQPAPAPIRRATLPAPALPRRAALPAPRLVAPAAAPRPRVEARPAPVLVERPVPRPRVMVDDDDVVVRRPIIRPVPPIIRPRGPYPRPVYDPPHRVGGGPYGRVPPMHYPGPRPGYDGPRPGYGGPLGFGGPRPGYGGPRPGYGGPHLGFSGPRPSYGGSRPAFGGSFGGSGFMQRPSMSMHRGW